MTPTAQTSWRWNTSLAILWLVRITKLKTARNIKWIYDWSLDRNVSVYECALFMGLFIYCRLASTFDYIDHNDVIVNWTRRDWNWQDLSYSLDNDLLLSSSPVCERRTATLYSSFKTVRCQSSEYETVQLIFWIVKCPHLSASEVNFRLLIRLLGYQRFWKWMHKHGTRFSFDETKFRHFL